MKLVFASDSFKGTLTSAQICSLLEEAAAEALPGAECVSLPMADGGEGTLDVIRSVRDGQEIPLYVYNALKGRMRTSLFVSGDEAFVEAATTCGLSLFDASELDPIAATSNGVGAFISHALFHGCKHITIGLGGTCTNDGGMGCLRALGVRFFDQDGNELSGCGADLARVARIDESGLFEQIRHATFTIMCDVTNPLLGPNGATHVFGRQKGASKAMLERLEAGMTNFADVISQTHPEVDFDTPGFGAAGGLGMALSVFLDAQMSSGIETLLDWVGFDAALEGADLVVTGEGQLDEQSLQGKAVSGVVAHAKRIGVPVAAIVGKSTLSEAQIQALGLDHLIEAGRDPSPADAYAQAARQLFASLS